MKLHALVRISVDLDDADKAAFRDAVARLMSRGAEPEDFEKAATATPESALAVLLGTKMVEEVHSVIARTTVGRYNGVYCSTDDVRREPENIKERTKRLGIAHGPDWATPPE